MFQEPGLICLVDASSGNAGMRPFEMPSTSVAIPEIRFGAGSWRRIFTLALSSRFDRPLRPGNASALPYPTRRSPRRTPSTPGSTGKTTCLNQSHAFTPTLPSKRQRSLSLSSLGATSPLKKHALLARGNSKWSVPWVRRSRMSLPPMQLCTVFRSHEKQWSSVHRNSRVGLGRVPDCRIQRVEARRTLRNPVPT